MIPFDHDFLSHIIYGESCMNGYSKKIENIEKLKY